MSCVSIEDFCRKEHIASLDLVKIDCEGCDYEVLFDSALSLQTCSYMYRRNFVPLFDPRLKYYNDYLFDVEVFKNGKLGYIDEVLGTYRRHDKNLTKASDVPRVWFEEQLVALAIITARYPELSKLVKARRTQAYIARIGRCLLDGDQTRAKMFSKALFFDGAHLNGVLLLALSNVVSSDVIQRLLESDNRVIRAVVDNMILSRFAGEHEKRTQSQKSHNLEVDFLEAK